MLFTTVMHLSQCTRSASDRGITVTLDLDGVEQGDPVTPLADDHRDAVQVRMARDREQDIG